MFLYDWCQQRVKVQRELPLRMPKGPDLINRWKAGCYDARHADLIRVYMVAWCTVPADHADVDVVNNARQFLQQVEPIFRQAEYVGETLPLDYEFWPDCRFAPGEEMPRPQSGGVVSATSGPRAITREQGQALSAQRQAFHAQSAESLRPETGG